MKKLPFLLLLNCVFAFGLSAARADYGHTKGREIAPLTGEFKPGDYVWKPEVSPAGPVLIVVSLPDQKMAVFRNGIRIGTATVSTGTKGHTTPTGVFTILQKKVDHESSIYKGAKMPHMQRLTWTGIAMHAGNLPGYPAQHGCVRLPSDFAARLYTVTTLGTTVIITDGKSVPSVTANTGSLLTNASGAPLAAGAFEWEGEKAPKGPVSIVFSLADRHAYAYRNGVLIGRAGFQFKGSFKGTYAYSALATVDSAGHRDWLATESIGGGRAPDPKSLAQNLSIAPEFVAHLREAIAPGATLILSDLPVSPQTRSKSGFGILTTAFGGN